MIVNTGKVIPIKIRVGRQIIARNSEDMSVRNISDIKIQSGLEFISGKRTIQIRFASMLARRTSGID